MSGLKEKWSIGFILLLTAIVAGTFGGLSYARGGGESSGSGSYGMRQGGGSPAMHQGGGSGSFRNTGSWGNRTSSGNFQRNNFRGNTGGEMRTYRSFNQSPAPRFTRTEPSQVVRNEPSRTVRTEQSRFVRNEPSQLVKSEPSQFVRNESPRFVRNEPSQNVRKESSQSVRTESSKVVRAEPSQIVRNEPSRLVRSRPANFNNNSESRFLTRRDSVSGRNGFVRNNDAVRHNDRFVGGWNGGRDRVFRKITTPSHSFDVRFHHGHHSQFQHFHPFFHRKFAFVSYCGFWPNYYYPLRYYWYGYYPYDWYGYMPQLYEVQSDGGSYYTYNYNTYNYGNGGTDGSEAPQTTIVESAPAAEPQSQKPAAETDADKLFASGVDAFEKGDYSNAAGYFQEAMQLDDKDIIVPFAYSQALLANGQYPQAAQALREAISKIPPNEENIYYPRGLYTDDKTLFAQINTLEEQVNANENDGNMQLLLGYQFMGIGRTDEAVKHLQQAGQYTENAQAVEVLNNLIVKMQTGQQDL